MSRASSDPPRPRPPGTTRPVTSVEGALCWGIAGALAGLPGIGCPEDNLGLGGAAIVIGGAALTGWCAGALLPRLRRSPAAGAVGALVRAMAFATGGAVLGTLAGALVPAGPAEGPWSTGAAGCAGAIAGVALGCVRTTRATGQRLTAEENGWPLGWPLLGAIVAAVAGAALLERSGAGAADVGAVFGAVAGGCYGLARPRRATASPVVWAIAGAGLGAGAVVALDARAIVSQIAAGALAGAISGELWSQP